jgi:hypothetical protein
MLVMLGFSQRLQLSPCSLFPASVRFFNDFLLKGLDPLGREALAWEVRH